jgi:hypothetical protein
MQMNDMNETKTIRIQVGFSVWSLSALAAAAYLLSIYLSH